MNDVQIMESLNRIRKYLTSIGMDCEEIEHERIKGLCVTIAFDDTIVPKEEYVLAYIDAPEAVLSFSSIFQIYSAVEFPTDKINPGELALLVNHINTKLLLGSLFIDYTFEDGKDMKDGVIHQKYTFAVSDDREFPYETLCEVIILLAEQKRLFEYMLLEMADGKTLKDILSE